jgi:hypothetical protein
MTGFRHSPKRIVLHAERLVLRGIERADASAVSAGLQAELRARLAGEGGAAGLTAQDGVPAVRAGTARVALGGDAGAIGRAVAASIVQRGKP